MGSQFRTVLVQFSFASFQACPMYLPELEPEQGYQDHLRRKTVQAGRQGVQIIQPTEKVGVAPFMMDLNANGWVLVNAGRQRRIHDQKREPYCVARFVFYPAEHARVDASIAGMQDLAYSGLMRLATESFWRVRAFNNPYLSEHELPIEDRALSVNLEVRTPRVNEREQWCLGTGPNARNAQPAHLLRLRDGIPMVVVHTQPAYLI